MMRHKVIFFRDLLESKFYRLEVYPLQWISKQKQKQKQKKKKHIFCKNQNQTL